MAVPELAPRRTMGTIVAVWIVAAVIGVVIGVFVDPQLRTAWLMVALGGCLILTFAIQLWIGRSQGFIRRVAASILGALVVLGIISLGLGLAAFVSG